MEQTIYDFALLFRGRGDVYGSDSGSCVKQPLTETVIEQHFDDTPIGVYPMMSRNGEWFVSWGCVDFDTADAEQHATRLHDSLMDAGVISWIERSRSKGYHVWVFASAPVPAEQMRYMLMAACLVAEVPTTEVNPKQTTLRQGQYGNYVRLPYAGYNHNPDYDRQRVLFRDSLTPIPLEQFISSALRYRTDPSDITRIAEFYVPPTVSTSTVNEHEYDATLDEAMTVLSPLGKVIWRDGPLQGRDRSSTLAKLGHECVRAGLNPSQTKTVLRTADQRWGKYHLRHNGDIEIDKLVVRVHS